MTLSIATLPPSPLPSPAELTHYKSLFSKLRFSYREQVTKESLLRALAADPPSLEPLSASALAALEAEVATDKSALKKRKAEVHDALSALDRKSRAVARRAVELEAQEELLAKIPNEIEGLKAEVQALRPAEEEVTDPRLGMGMEKTLALAEERRAEAEGMEAEITALRKAIDARKADVTRLRAEAERAAERKTELVGEVKRLQRRDESGDEMERRGRFARAQLQVLQKLVG